MVNPLSSEFLSAVLQTILGAVLTALAYLARKGYELVKIRNVRKYWRSFSSSTVTVVLTEYPVVGNDQLANIAKVAGGGWLISKGMALSLAHLLEFLESRVTKRKDIVICGSQSGTLTTDNLIILGGPSNNSYARSMYSHLSSMYDMPYDIHWEKDGVPIEIGTPSGMRFTPRIEDGLGHDYALVVRALYQAVPPKWVLIVSGCYMWGTQAAANAVTDPRILNEVLKEVGDASSIAFIIRTRVVNGGPTGPEIDIDNRRYIQPLKPKDPVQEDEQ